VASSSITTKPAPAGAFPTTISAPPWLTRLGAAAFVGFPLAMLGFSILNGRSLPRDDARLYLQQIADLGNRFPAATLAYLVAAALNLVVGLAIVRLLGKRPSGLIAGGFTMFAALGSFGFGAMNLLLWSLVDELGVSDDLVRGYEAFQDSLGFLFLAMITLPAAIVAAIALVTGLIRSRIAPPWVPVAIIAGFIAGSGELGRYGNIAGGILGTTAGVGLALALLHAPEQTRSM